MQQLPLFEPPSDWVPPVCLPDIPSGLVVAIDSETRDDGLSSERGPGWVTQSGHVAGVSVAWGQEAIYVPVRHPDTECQEPEKVARWLTDLMDRSARVVFHNQSYDQGWLGVDGAVVPDGKTDDTLAMAVMLDENRDRYSLDACCSWRKVPGKDERALREAAATYGLDPKKDLWRLPARHVAGYAMQDAVATLRLRENLAVDIEKENLGAAYRLEMDLVPMIIQMRKNGIRVDEDAADQAQVALRARRETTLANIARQLGWKSVTMEAVRSPLSLERMMEAEGVQFPRTPKTKVGSFSSDWMKKAAHWLPRAVVEARQLDDLAEKFIGTYILENTWLGRIHAEIHQLRDETGGTRSYRLSYSDPPLQQIPVKSDDGRLIRSCFVAEPGALWYSADYSQQEPRLAVHFASRCGLEGAEAAVEYYATNPDADFHSMVAELTGVPRGKAKIINLGLMYGMGLGKLATSLGVTEDDAKVMLDQYHKNMPFVAKLTDFCASRAKTKGFIRLLDGARCRFDMWERTSRDEGPYQAPRPRDVAEALWPKQNLRRAFTHKSMNRLIQGSAARQTKMAMRACWQEKIVPLIQLHDELGFSISDPRDADRALVLMRDVVKLHVPMKVDGQFGRSWGQASEETPKGMQPPSFEELMAAA